MTYTTTTALKQYRIIFRLGIFLTLLNCTSLLQAQSGVQWSNSYGGSSNDIPSSVQATIDNGYIIAGQSASSDSLVSANYGKYDAWVVKINAAGELLWEKNYGGSSDDYALDIQTTSDSGYVMIGGSFSNNIDLSSNEGDSDIWVMKLGAEGESQWSKTFGGKGLDFGTSIQQTTDGGYILSACTGSGGDTDIPPGAGGNDILVIKLDTDGNMEWQKLYGGSRHDGPKKIIQTSDGGYLVGGNTWSTNGDITQNNGHSDALFLKLDETGAIEWSKSFGGVTTDRLNDFLENQDGDFVMTGTYSALDLVGNGFGGRYDENFWILKFDASGNQLWQQNYGGSKYDEAKSISTTSDGGYLIGGVANSANGDVPGNNGLKDLWVLKTNHLGEVDWSQSFGGQLNEEIVAVSNVGPDQYLLVAYSNSVFVDTLFENNGLEDWWVIKMGDANTSISVDLGEDLTLCANEEFYFDVSIPSCVCQYEWNDGSFDSQRTLSAFTTTTYSVTITDPNGFSVADEIVVNIVGPEISINTSDISCFGQNDGAIDLVPGANYSYLWEDGLTLEDRENLSAGTYLVTVTDDVGCSQLQIITINEPPAISLNETVTQISCYGEADGMINLNPSGGTGNFDYNWTNTSNPNVQDISGLSSGNYAVTVIDDNNCSTASSWNITQPDEISIGLIPSLTSCFDSEDGQVQINVNGGIGTLDYKWSNGAMTPNLTEVAAGTYTITVTDANLCEATKNVTISSPLEIEVDAIVTLASCSGNNDGSILTTVSGGIGNHQYIWNTGDTSPDLENIMAGTYTVTVSDDNMCQQVTEFVVSQNSDIEISSNISHLSCYDGNDGAININPSGGSGTYTYSWNTGDITQNINQLIAGDYIVTVSDPVSYTHLTLPTICSV